MDEQKYEARCIADCEELIVSFHDNKLGDVQFVYVYDTESKRFVAKDRDTVFVNGKAVDIGE